METKIAVFKGKGVRKVIYNNEWWFSVVDACGALTDSLDAGAYWRKLKQRLKEEGSEVVTFCHGLKLEAPDGKKYETDCADTEGIFRIIQSIPSPKAEPFKRWLVLEKGQLPKFTALKIRKACRSLNPMPKQEEILPVMPENNWKKE